MGLFSNPKCPKCGNKTVETGYSFPYPAYRCSYCVREDAEQQEDNDELEGLKKRITALEIESIKHNK